MIARSVAPKLSEFLYQYSESKEIYMKINFVNVDHVHALIDLPTNLSIGIVVNLFKGASSRWMGAHPLRFGHFQWGRGYGIFSVSESHLDRVCKYIAQQEEHHRKRSFMDEYRLFVERHGLKWAGNIEA